MVPPSTAHPGDNIKKNCHLNLLLKTDIFCSRQYAGSTFGRLSLDFCSAAFCSVSQTVDWFIRWTLRDVFFSLFHQGTPNLRLFNQLYWVLFSSVNIITVWQDFGWLGLGWDPRARIQFGRANFRVFSTPRFAPLALSSDWITGGPN